MDEVEGVALMVKKFLGSLLEAIITLWLLATLCFFLLRAAPGGPFDTEKSAPPEVQAVLNQQYRLDLSLPEQYVRWLGDVVRGDLGPSFQYPDYTVNQLIAQALPVSALNGGLALLLALGIGIPLGIFAAKHSGSWIDRIVMFVASLGISIPKFVVAPMLVLVFAVMLKWLPAGGWGDWKNIVLPIIALALPNIAYCARIMRASMSETLNADYLVAARSRGFSSARLLMRHALRPALMPVVAWLSPALINVVTGSAVIEQVFGIPGMGRYFVQGALNRDYTLVLGVVLVVGLLIVVINLLVDILRRWMDPRLAR